MEIYKLLSRPVAAELEDTVDTTGLSAITIIEIALIKLFANEKNFLACPRCGSYLAIKDAFTGETAVESLRCGCGMDVQYDTEEDYILNN